VARTSSSAVTPGTTFFQLCMDDTASADAKKTIAFLLHATGADGLAQTREGQCDVAQTKSQTLDTLTVDDPTLVDLSPVAAFGALKTLTVHGVPITSAGFASELSFLETLDIEGASIVSLQDLRSLPHLTTLRILPIYDYASSAWRGAQVSELFDGAGFPALQTLYMPHNALTSLAPLRGLTALKELYVGSNHLATLADIPALPALALLDVSENAIDDLAPLAAFRLTTLDASGNRLASLADLAGTPLVGSLQSLMLEHNLLTSVDVAPPNVTYLDFSANRICDFAPIAARIVARTPGTVSYDCGEQSCETGGFVASTEVGTSEQDRSACAPDPVATERGWTTVLRCQTSELQVDPSNAKNVALVVTQGEQSFWYESTPVTNLFQYVAGRSDLPVHLAADYGSFGVDGTSSVSVATGADFQRLDVSAPGGRAEVVKEATNLHLRVFEGSAQKFDWVFPGCM
jgi:hypothetical protein